MLNYANLNDVEFEYLCNDIMSKKLGIELQRFTSGRDGGVDLTNDAFHKNIIVQVKHYVKTDVDGLIRSLSKEVSKVKKMKPKQYYVCCSKELTAQNKSDIYELFSDYMASTANIITLIEIDDFLSKPENADILYKHFKLWIESTNILTKIFTNDICIDSDVLLSDIKEDAKFFVKTTAFQNAIESLKKCNALIIIGNPGVGKTITSKMLVLYYASQGYKVRFTTDGSDLSGLKKALSASPKVKEVILLDDCFGQAYFSMKETQESELLSLIKHIKMNENKILIMNSRVTIFKEAGERNSYMLKSFDNKECRVFMLDLNRMSDLEKAKIFYNHLFFNNVPTDHLQCIKEGRKYLSIIKHTNYSPRIIEYVCHPRTVQSLSSESYIGFIMENLNNPQQIWKNEYERRLDIPDRVLLTTLFSLTNTTISISQLEACFNQRLVAFSQIDLSINHFSQSMNRLLDGFIKIVDDKGKRMVSVANPSVNDFLSAYLENNIAEKNQIVSTICSIQQCQRMLSETDSDAFIKNAFMDGSIVCFHFESDKEKTAYITYYISQNKIQNPTYKSYVLNYLRDVCPVRINDNRMITVDIVLKNLLDMDVCLFYDVPSIIRNIDILSDILQRFDLPELSTILPLLDSHFSGAVREQYLQISKQILEEAIETYCCDVPADEFDIDISEIAAECEVQYEYGTCVDEDLLSEKVNCMMIDIVENELYSYISALPTELSPSKSFLSDLEIVISGIDHMIGYVREPDYDYDDDYLSVRDNDDTEIDYIFNR